MLQNNLENSGRPDQDSCKMNKLARRTMESKASNKEGAKPGYLFVITSSNQLFSGTGTAIFEWIRYAKDSYAFAIAIDNSNPKNFKICLEFCRNEAIPILVSGPAQRRGAADPGVADSLEYVRQGQWKIVEIVSWANSATNLDVLASIREDQILVYTPHTQPTWTIPGAENLYLLEPAFEAAIRAADIVCCDSPAELDKLKRLANTSNCIYSPLAVNTDRFKPPASHKKSKEVLLIADFREIRKRTDLAVNAMVRLMRRNPNATAALAGRGSEEVELPIEFGSRFKQHGYVNDNELVKLYQNSGVFLLLSDFEAFGIPIAEALSCGTPVVTTENPEMSSLYQGLAGCTLVDNKDEDAIDSAVDEALGNSDPQLIAKAAHEKFGLHAAFKRKSERLQELIERKLEAPQTRGQILGSARAK
mgnify:CR=1 FL=1